MESVQAHVRAANGLNANTIHTGENSKFTELDVTDLKTWLPPFLQSLVYG